MIAGDKIANFQRWLRMFAWALAAIGISSSPLAAQGIMRARFVVSSASVSMSAKPVPAAVIPVVEPVAMAVAASVEVRNTTIWEASGIYRDNHNSTIEDRVEMSETPFGQQYQMPIGSLLGGRIRLSGFGAMTPMETILQGLPGGGSFLAMSSAPMGHAGLKTPKDDNRYGLSLTLHHAGSVENALSFRLVRCVGRLVGRGCR
jgi:hypothetical protein